uniref:Fe2OG dioxygenase domain-containing protein n=1 Tax=Aureoumbra lagunensis TaxID=44058 RepID=A0A7S3NQU1_9STRA|mmetsp:Transcript_15193/g.22800  ORF Transcript_15193/g.22800 Transcript_15193/m.22800 type:complete len:241 (-) Transcript_15193:7-729(-)
MMMLVRVIFSIVIIQPYGLRLENPKILLNSKSSEIIQRQSEALKEEATKYFAQEGIVYIENFFRPRVFNELQRQALMSISEMRPETPDHVAVGRLGTFVSPSTPLAEAVNSKPVQNFLQDITSSDQLQPSDFPVELRRYPIGSSMDWHCDESLYENPQVECVLTIFNSCDSRTEWKKNTDPDVIVSRWTQPNSLLLVKAGGPSHRVTRSSCGERVIAKFVYTSCPYKLNAWYSNLNAYIS